MSPFYLFKREWQHVLCALVRIQQRKRVVEVLLSNRHPRHVDLGGPCRQPPVCQKPIHTAAGNAVKVTQHDDTRGGWVDLLARLLRSDTTVKHGVGSERIHAPVC